MVMAIKTRVTERLGIEAPILQAGMATRADATLAASVSNAGGLGIIGTVDRELDDIKAQMAQVRKLTTKPFGVNSVLAYASDELWTTIISQRPPLVQSAWGDPRELTKRVHAAGLLHAHQVTTVETAKQAVAAGVDFIIAQGAEAGGHVGFVGLIALLPQVVDVAEGIPVIAAGGIVDGRGLAAALAMGAEGVLVGTRFLATYESPIPDYYKDAIAGAESEFIVHTDIPDLIWNMHWDGATTRVARNKLIRNFESRTEFSDDEREELANQVRAAYDRQEAEFVPLYMGQGAGGIKQVESSAQIVRQLVSEAEQLLENAHRFVNVQLTSA
jgi:NAD(P)H-dependent flavin oxidoreductase YrpB (nitropropane dioxygenase family)